MKYLSCLLVLALVVPASANLLTNGGFESGTAGWTGGSEFGAGASGPIWDPGPAPEGTQKGWVQNGNAVGNHLAYQTVAVTGGSNLTLTGWVALGAWSAAEHGVFVYDGAGTGGAILAKQSAVIPGGPVGTGWNPVNINIAVPGPTTQITVAFGWINGAAWSNGNATYADGLDLTPEPTTLLLLSLGVLPFLRRRRA